jgi:hypothetical protein
MRSSSQQASQPAGALWKQVEATVRLLAAGSSRPGVMPGVGRQDKLKGFCCSPLPGAVSYCSAPTRRTV